MLMNKIFVIFYLSLIIIMFAGCGGSADFNPNSATGSFSLEWNVPTTYVDGTVAKGVAGYKVYYGTTSRMYTYVIDVKNVTNYMANSLPHGTYYVAVTAYDSSGIESDYSIELIKTT